MNLFFKKVRKYPTKFNNYLFNKYLKPRVILVVKYVLMHEKLVFNSNGQLTIGDTSNVSNALFNLSSGNISIGNFVSFGHNVSCLTGTHDISMKDTDRQFNYPTKGNDIIIEDGVWVGSNVTIVGPCKIGKNAAIAAHSLVNKDVPENMLYGGVPAKFLKNIEFNIEKP